jgi:hypothetical protein
MIRSEAGAGWIARNLHAIEQRLPRRNGREWKRGGFGKSDAGRFAPHDAFIYALELRIRAGPTNVAGVINFIARLEKFYVIANGRDHARRIPAQNLQLTIRLSGTATRTDFRIHWIHGNRPDFHEQIARRRLRRFRRQIQQAVGIGNR